MLRVDFILLYGLISGSRWDAGPVVLGTCLILKVCPGEQQQGGDHIPGSDFLPLLNQLPLPPWSTRLLSPLLLLSLGTSHVLCPPSSWWHWPSLFPWVEMVVGQQKNVNYRQNLK